MRRFFIRLVIRVIVIVIAIRIYKIKSTHYKLYFTKQNFILKYITLKNIRKCFKYILQMKRI